MSIFRSVDAHVFAFMEHDDVVWALINLETLHTIAQEQTKFISVSTGIRRLLFLTQTITTPVTSDVRLSLQGNIKTIDDYQKCLEMYRTYTKNINKSFSFCTVSIHKNTINKVDEAWFMELVGDYYL